MSDQVESPTESVTNQDAPRAKRRTRLIIVAVVAIVVAAGVARLSGTESSSNQPGDATESEVTSAVDLINSGLYNDAIGLLQTSLAENPDDPVALYNLGVAYQFSGNLTEAESAYSRAITLDSSNPDALYNRGLARRDLGNLEGARDDLRAASDLAPEWAAAKLNLAGVLRSLGATEEADALQAEAESLGG